ncbi:hypothetical protein IWW48_003811 [Coemansia sp. RSA 1200]|nr:hypothetical protein IWW48_003811 [Coemansia sp. RSA 1200]
MANTGGMQTVIDEIRHSRNWITKIVSNKRHEQRAMLLCSPPIQPASSGVIADTTAECSAQIIPLQQVPPVCHVQRHTADDDNTDGFLVDEERSAAERQLKFHHRHTTDDHICALVSGYTAGSSESSSSEGRLVSPAADDYNGPLKHGCCGRQTNSTATAITTKSVMFGLTQAMLLLFVVALGADVRSRPMTPVFWHPLIMAAMLVLSVEAIAVLQVSEWPIPPHRKRILHIVHITLHCLSATAGVVGVGECIYFKRRMLIARDHPPQEEKGATALLETTNGSSTSSSSHACVGKLAVFLFLGQLVFGTYVRFSSLPTRAGGQPKHYLKKYHRAAGYVVLFFLWLSAWLGIHSRQWVSADGQKAGGLVSNWIWGLVFVGLMVGVLVPIDRAKFGFK